MKRILSLFVVFAMVVSMIPTVFAEKTEIDMDELLGRLEILDTLDVIQVKLDEGATGKVYQYTPEKNGVLSLLVDFFEPEGTEMDIVITQGENTVRYSECEGAFELEVVQDENVQITVSKSSEPAIEFSIYGSLNDPYGSESNPYMLQELVTEVTTTFENAWFGGRFGGADLVVTGDGEFTVTADGVATKAVDGVVTMPVVTMSPFMPFMFTIDAVGTYTIEFVYPIGSYANPEILFRPNFIAVNIAEGNDQGYYYKWTSNTDGTLKLTCPTVEGVAYNVILTNQNTYDMAWLSDSEDGTVSLAVNAGDEILIQVVAEPIMAEDYSQTYPALETSLTGEIIFPIGHQMNPDVLFRPAYIAVEIAEGNSQGYYYKWTSNADGTLKLTCPAVEGVEYDVILTNMNGYAMAWLSESEDGTVSIDMKAGDEIIIQVVAMPDESYNYPALSVALTGEIIFPIGHQMNPDVLFRPAYIQVELAEGNAQGYYYKWTSNANGTLTLTCPTVEGVEYDVILTNMNGFAMAWLSESEDGTVSIDMKAGDEIIIQVVAIPDESYNYPALSVALTGEIAFAKGDMMNPAALVIGENTAEIAAGNAQGYYYKWTAEANGELTITMPEGDWVYAVTNITTGVYGDTLTSDSDPVQNTYTVKVSAGDEIQIMVNTYNPEDMFNNPAGTLVVTAAFNEITYIPGDLDGNEDVNEDDAIYLLQHVLMGDMFPVNQPVDYDGVAGVNEDDAIYLLQHVLMGDMFPLA